MESFVAGDFWADLSSAVAGLKEVLEHPDAVEDSVGDVEEDLADSVDTTLQHQHLFNGSSGSHRLLFGQGGSSKAACNLSPSLKDWLLNVYKERVDCLFKPLHWHSTLFAIQHQSSRLQDEKSSIDAKALENAIYFTSTCSLFDHELDGRQTLVEQLRRATEDALVESDLLTTTSLVVLQAFVVYLVSIHLELHWSDTS